MNLRSCWFLFALVLLASLASAQEDESFTRRNTWTVFGEYSNDSSHIILGVARQRRLADAGVSYARRLFRSRIGDFSYLLEVRPVMFESDPITMHNYTEIYSTPPMTLTAFGSEAEVSPCVVATYVQTVTIIGEPSGTDVGTITATDQVSCGRQWTFAQAFSPVGFKQSFRRGKPMQPFFTGTLGYMYSNRPIPIQQAGSFNFQFDIGAGLELFRSSHRSVALEYRIHHISNKGTALQNPGIDSQVLKLSYNFGR